MALLFQVPGYAGNDFHISITLTVRSCLTRQCIFLYMFFYYRIKYCLNQVPGYALYSHFSHSLPLDTTLYRVEGQVLTRIYPAELQLNKANSSDTEAPFLDLNLFISNGTVSTKMYDKRDDFDFDIVNFAFLDGDVPRRTSYGVYISELILFARASSNVSDFNCRNKALTAKLLKQGYRYHKLRKAFSKFYRRHSELVEKYNVSLRKLLQQGI